MKPRLPPARLTLVPNIKFKEGTSTEAAEITGLRCGLYARLSKEDKRGKKSKVDSVTVQLSHGTETIQAEGGRLALVLKDDDKSGRLTERPGLDQLIAACDRRELDVVVVRDLDRLGRFDPAQMMHFLVELQSRGVRVWSYRTKSFETLKGQESLMTYMRALFAAEEAEKDSQRITSDLRYRLQEGRAVKSGGLGYRIETQQDGAKFWRIQPDEAARAIHIAELFVELRSKNGVATALNVEGIPCPRGGTWRNSSVDAVLRRPLYRGFYKHGAVTREFPELRIFSPELETAIDALLARPSKPWGSTPRHLSTRFVRCGACQGSVVVTSSARSKSTSIVCDRQRSRGCKGIGYRSEPHVDAALLRLAKRAIDEETWGQLRTWMREALEAQRLAERQENQVENLKREVTKLERQVKNAAAELIEADDVVKPQLRAVLHERGKQLTSTKAALEQASKVGPRVSTETLLAEADRRVEELRASLDAGGIEALPALSAILGDEKVTASKHPDGWRLTWRTSMRHVFEGSDIGLKQTVRNYEPLLPGLSGVLVLSEVA